MGFFSFKTADTKQSIFNTCTEKCRPVYMFQPNNEDPIYEPAYEGYGVFGGVDAYTWLAKHNLPTTVTNSYDDDELRTLGIKLAFGLDSFEYDNHLFIKENELDVLRQVNPALLEREFTQFQAFSDFIIVNGEEIRPNDLPSHLRTDLQLAPVKYPLKFSFRKGKQYSDYPASESCPYQGYFI
ncbi:hypothetical protein [Vibrio europaeus]|uniref:Uncharacterized protein n=1 Tax=Vibrio europaeus TaxID=300876 RepID=A0ABT5GST1_9VIBR|nr:hypothetical protein [Vibrio europaeus]OQQ01620.1 hypothetical protein BK411_23230 [Vibrio splendidus]MDC5725617.1 hypothetical protein [Vibrio europaeus]MDC5728219.1 hypothetical protein [Vibrio europaeus]MDC5734431.1 hypothetical protein [Vibrio europaeus]MDC5739712.1 hypothetical protein [Vibrio europaeus]